MIKLAIFDLDGTLLDTRTDLGNACNYALSECGFPKRNLDDYCMLVGRGIDNLFRKAMPESEASEENVKRMRSVFVPYYTEHIADYTLPYKGIVEMLETLRAAGISLAVASNKFQSGTENLVGKFFSGFDFVKILGQREGNPLKPDAAIVKECIAGYEALRGEKIELSEVVYVGDSDVDMKTGINARVTTIGVLWGFRTREELAAYNPYLLAATAEEISETVLGL
ncbi:MAG: HAD family hydrolase [Bacteroidales bacterium]|nr:HAD family hydrolase [Bacteroidales bacterium]